MQQTLGACGQIGNIHQLCFIVHMGVGDVRAEIALNPDRAIAAIAGLGLENPFTVLLRLVQD